MKQILVVLSGLALVLFGLAGTASASPAAAAASAIAVSAHGADRTLVAVAPTAGIKPLSCQAANATLLLHLSNGNLQGYDCTGTYFPNVSATRLDAGGWSGFITWNGTSTAASL
jgi:hypothetical protein